MTMVLLRDQFVNALMDPQMKIYIKQTHPSDLQESLARALEFESFVRTSGSGPAIMGIGRNFKARRSQATDSTGQVSLDTFRGKCWDCGQRGHCQSECKEMHQTSPAERSRQYQTCCWWCGQLSSISSACSQHEPLMTQLGNDSRLGRGDHHQPEPPQPHSR